MRRYRCSDCERDFQVPADSPRTLDGLTDSEYDALSCPWCDGVAREIEA